MRRSQSGTLRNPPKLCYESRLRLAWQSGRTAHTASRLVDSRLPFSTYPPNKTLLWDLVTACQQHQPCQRSDLLQMDPHSHAPQGNPSWFRLLSLQLNFAQRISWKSSACYPGVSRRRHWSRAKWRLPWNYRNTAWCQCVSTQKFFLHARQ